MPMNRPNATGGINDFHEYELLLVTRIRSSKGIAAIKNVCIQKMIA